jgi:dihydroorotate dehydrogenase (NAD+) catalytic subunit
MNAAGTLGFAPDPRAGIDLDELGAFVTNPLSLRPRLPAVRPALIEFPGGFLIHTGLPNPGLSAALNKYATRWERSPLPIIIHLMAGAPEDTARMVEKLESLENILAVELGFAARLANDILLLTLQMCFGELPLIVSLPAEKILSLGPRLMDAGASAISISPARGALPRPGTSSPIGKGELMAGRLFGPSQYPIALEIVHAASKIGLPVIGAGGIWNETQASEMLSAGALAVQMDARLWLPA